MIKRLTSIVFLSFLLFVWSSCSDSQPGDPCATLNPPPTCEAQNNEHSENNDNNVNNVLCDPECSGETAVCMDGACVECVVGADCESGVCDETTNTCTGCVDNDECTGATPRCDASMCVACDTVSDEGCGDETPFCETVDGDAVCVACDAPGTTASCPAGTTCTDAFVCSSCESNDECTEADASVCEAPGTEAAACVPCQQSGDCDHIAGRNSCDGGHCIECTAATEATDCDGNVCDTTASECTDEGIRSVLSGRPCVADTSCAANSYCVPVDYQGSFHGNYCLPIPASFGDSGCTRPFGGGPSNRTTVRGQTVEVCSFRENLVTPEAVSAYGDICTVRDDPLVNDAPFPGECEINGVAAPGARCQLIRGIPRCTYSCADDDDCFISLGCGGATDVEYCGGS